MALELGVMPPHTLDTEQVRHLCGQLTQGVLKLLMFGVETLRSLSALEVISPYLSAIQRALLSELQQSNRYDIIILRYHMVSLYNVEIIRYS